MWDSYCENLRFAIPGTSLYNQFIQHGCDPSSLKQAGPGLPAPQAPNPMCDAGKTAALLPITDPQFQTYFGTQDRINAYIAQCGPISLPQGTGGGSGGGVVCKTGWQIDPVTGTCMPIEQPSPPITPIVIHPTPIKVPLTPSPNCIGANYTVNAQGQCVYPAGGPSGGYSPPLVVTDTGQQFWSASAPPAVCPDGSQPDILGACAAPAPAPPSALQTIEHYLSNPWVLGGAAVVIYLATRKKRRAHR